MGVFLRVRARGTYELLDGVTRPADLGTRPWLGRPLSLWAKHGGPVRVFECERGGRACGVVWDREWVRGWESGRGREGWRGGGDVEEERGEGALSADAFEMR